VLIFYFRDLGENIVHYNLIEKHCIGPLNDFYNKL